MPSKDVLDTLAERNKPGDRWRTLEVARKHAKWAQVKEEQNKKREDDQEAERSMCLSFSIIVLCLSISHSCIR